jgi:hypothetical protein
MELMILLLWNIFLTKACGFSYVRITLGFFFLNMDDNYDDKVSTFTQLR